MPPLIRSQQFVDTPLAVNERNKVRGNLYNNPYNTETRVNAMDNERRIGELEDIIQQ